MMTKRKEGEKQGTREKAHDLKVSHLDDGTFVTYFLERSKEVYNITYLEAAVWSSL